MDTPQSASSIISESGEHVNARTIPGMHIDAQLIAKRMRELFEPEGVPDYERILTYREISKILHGTDDDGNPPELDETDRRRIYAAIKHNISRHEIVAINVRTQGYKRATDEELVAGGGDTVKLIHKKSKRSIKTLVLVRDVDKLSTEHTTAYYTNMSMLAALKAATSNKTIRRIEVEVESTNDMLSEARALKAFASN